jgi:hypothetical protein
MRSEMTKSPKRGLRFFGCFIALALVSLASAWADDQMLEAKVKAAYIYNFTRFVEWPNLEREGNKAELRICLSENEALVPFLAELLTRENKGHPLQIVHLGEKTDIARCHLIFYGADSERRLSRHLENLPAAGVLTVSDVPQFCRKGGMIGFFSEGGRIRIEINQNAARQANLRLSAKLLEVARVIE